MLFDEFLFTLADASLSEWRKTCHIQDFSSRLCVFEFSIETLIFLADFQLECDLSSCFLMFS